MAVVSVTLRDFRSYERAVAHLGPGLTVVSGQNGAGKTNLLEALYFGCTGRSCRTANDRELVRFGAPATRVTVICDGRSGPHEFAVGFSPGAPKRMTADGAPVERLLDAPFRPLVSVFLPDRLELVKGMPSIRRAHLDHFVAALWPARAAHRRSYAQTLAQRNALLTRLRAGHGSQTALSTWDAELARHAIALMSDRSDAVSLLARPYAAMCEQLGLDGQPSLAYLPRSKADCTEAFIDELATRLIGDLDRGFTGHGPHRDELLLRIGSQELRTFGSQGQQRAALLALLLAERQVIAEMREDAPLLLLDDVMSELDAPRRAKLAEVVRTGQAVISTTDLDHVPGAGASDVCRIAVSGGRLLEGAIAA